MNAGERLHADWYELIITANTSTMEDDTKDYGGFGDTWRRWEIFYTDTSHRLKMQIRS